MKKTDLYKNLALKINGQMKQAAVPNRFGKANSQVVNDPRKASLNPLVAKLLNKGTQ